MKEITIWNKMGSLIDKQTISNNQDLADLVLKLDLDNVSEIVVENSEEEAE